MNHMRVKAEMSKHSQQIVRPADIVVYGIKFFFQSAHRIGRGPLFAEMNDRVGRVDTQHVFQCGHIAGDIHIFKGDAPPGHFVPCSEAFLNGGHRRQAVGSHLRVDFTARQIINDHNITSTGRKMQCGGPAAKTITADNHYRGHV